MNLGALGGEKTMHPNVSAEASPPCRTFSRLCSRACGWLPPWDRFCNAMLMPGFAHRPASRKRGKEMMLGFLKSLLDDGHQQGKMVVLNFQNPIKPSRFCGKAPGLFEDYTAGLYFSFPLAKEILAFPFCIISQKLLAADGVCFGFCVFPSAVFRFDQFLFSS